MDIEGEGYSRSGDNRRGEGCSGDDDPTSTILPPVTSVASFASSRWRLISTSLSKLACRQPRLGTLLSHAKERYGIASFSRRDLPNRN